MISERRVGEEKEWYHRRGFMDGIENGMDGTELVTAPVDHSTVVGTVGSVFQFQS